MTFLDEPEEEISPEQAPQRALSPSALPDIPSFPNVGMVIESNTILKRDYNFDNRDLHVLVEIAGSEVTLDCQGHGISGAAPFGIRIGNQSNIKIKNCHINGVFVGINGWGLNNLSVIGGSFLVDMNGAHIFNSANIVFKNVIMKSSGMPALGYAIEFIGTKNTAVKKCDMENFDQGILLYSSDEFNVENNRIRYIVETGIGTFKTNDGKTTGNGRISGNKMEYTLMGLEIHTGSHNILIEKNRVADSFIAVKMDDEYGSDRFAPLSNVIFKDNEYVGNNHIYDANVQNTETIIIERNTP